MRNLTPSSGLSDLHCGLSTAFPPAERRPKCSALAAWDLSPTRVLVNCSSEGSEPGRVGAAAVTRPWAPAWQCRRQALRVFPCLARTELPCGDTGQILPARKRVQCCEKLVSFQRFLDFGIVGGGLWTCAECKNSYFLIFPL